MLGPRRSTVRWHAGHLDCRPAPHADEADSRELDDDEPLMRGLAALLARNDAGELGRRAAAEAAWSSQGHGQPRPSSVHQGSPSHHARVRPRPGLVIDGKRVLTRLIGVGSFGAVYEARQFDLDRLEAIKILHERWMDDAHHDIRARFLEEARVMARMRGPHLVEVHDWGTLPGGLPFFVMERLWGQTLRARLRAQASLSLPEFFDVAAQILAGLCEAHAHGVVHRDVKPENIFLADDGVKLLDFGLAQTPVMLPSDVAMGTPLYMAPETITGPRRTDARTDLYAASVVMYEMLSGGMPFRRPSVGRGALDRPEAAHEPPLPLRVRREDVPAELEALVLAGLAERPDDRPGTASEMLDRLMTVRARRQGGARTRPGREGEPTEPASLHGTSRATYDGPPPHPRRWAMVGTLVMLAVLELRLGWARVSPGDALMMQLGLVRPQVLEERPRCLAQHAAAPPTACRACAVHRLRATEPAPRGSVRLRGRAGGDRALAAPIP
jgi:tRNA A-37 threonylcarbamoyl transferase component Bud32